MSTCALKTKVPAKKTVRYNGTTAILTLNAMRSTAARLNHNSVQTRTPMRFAVWTAMISPAMAPTLRIRSRPSPQRCGECAGQREEREDERRDDHDLASAQIVRDRPDRHRPDRHADQARRRHRDGAGRR